MVECHQRNCVKIRMPEKKSADEDASQEGLAEAPPHYYGHRERLRERFREAGAEALSDYELLEAVLFRALPRRDLKPLAKTLIATLGSFAEAISAPEAGSPRSREWVRPALPNSSWCRRRQAGLFAAR